MRMDGVVPGNKWLQVLAMVIFDSIVLMGANCTDPVDYGMGTFIKGSISP